MRYYFMYENKRRKNKFLIEYPKLFAIDRHCSKAISSRKLKRGEDVF